MVQAEAEQTQAQARQREARELIHELGDLYHPNALDGALDDGAVQPVARVADRFADLWAMCNVWRSRLTCRRAPVNRSPKRKRLTVNWLAYLALFFATVETRNTALDLAPELQRSSPS